MREGVIRSEVERDVLRGKGDSVEQNTQRKPLAGTAMIIERISARESTRIVRLIVGLKAATTCRRLVMTARTANVGPIMFRYSRAGLASSGQCSKYSILKIYVVTRHIFYLFHRHLYSIHLSNSI